MSIIKIGDSVKFKVNIPMLVLNIRSNNKLIMEITKKVVVKKPKKRRDFSDILEKHILGFVLFVWILNEIILVWNLNSKYIRMLEFVLEIK